jgi:hypothetical protein
LDRYKGPDGPYGILIRSAVLKCPEMVGVNEGKNPGKSTLRTNGVKGIRGAGRHLTVNVSKLQKLAINWLAVCAGA